MTEPTTAPVSVPTDDLRKQVNELGALAQALFEAQFSRCDGGRMPADPSWDELEQYERDEFWEQARNAQHVIASRQSKKVALPADDRELQARIRKILEPWASTRGADGDELWDAVHAIKDLFDEIEGGVSEDLYAENGRLRDQLATAVEMVKICTGNSDEGVLSHFDMLQTAKWLHAEKVAEGATARDVLERMAYNADDQTWRADQDTQDLLNELVDELGRLAKANAAQPGTVTPPEGLDGLQRDIRFAISDPVSVVGRQEDETVPAWSARAVMHVVAAAGLLRPVSSSPEPEGQTQ